MSTKGRSSPSGPVISERISNVSFSFTTNIDANSTLDDNSVVSSARVTDTVTVNPPAGGLAAGLMVEAWVPSNGVVNLRLANVTTAAIAAGAITVDLELHKHST